MSTTTECIETEGAFQAKPGPGIADVTFAFVGQTTTPDVQIEQTWTMSRREAIETAVELLVAADVDPEVIETVQVTA